MQASRSKNPNSGPAAVLAPTGLRLTIWALGLLATGHGHGQSLPSIQRDLRIETIDLVGGHRVRLLSVPLQQFDLRVLATAPVLKQGSASDASLLGLSRLLSMGAGARPVALLSGGFNREDPLDPVGALIENKKSYAPLSMATKSRGSMGRGYSLSGLLCIGPANQVSIESVDSFQDSRGACAWALQAGPVVVERDGRDAISKKVTGVSHRLIACEPRNGGRSVDFYWFDSISLLDVEQALKPRCSSALNLAGADQAGILLVASGAAAGSVNVPLPSILVIQPRSR
ncbi:hypothetical protein [Roseateles sp.]|uniref:hypothetical protein n=1 Tax=Roseateles sp. TaxID=1971397 RepID=UPI00286CA1A1|nr:hypothetical protein [Roseateles sp.]